MWFIYVNYDKLKKKKYICGVKKLFDNSNDLGYSTQTVRVLYLNWDGSKFSIFFRLGRVSYWMYMFFLGRSNPTRTIYMSLFNVFILGSLWCLFLFKTYKRYYGYLIFNIWIYEILVISHALQIKLSILN